ncbi:unnamed protein product, partial [Pleuronectes platessa]
MATEAFSAERGTNTRTRLSECQGDSVRATETESDALGCAHRQSHCLLKDTAATGQEREKCLSASLSGVTVSERDKPQYLRTHKVKGQANIRVTALKDHVQALPSIIIRKRIDDLSTPATTLCPFTLWGGEGGKEGRAEERRAKERRGEERKGKERGAEQSRGECGRGEIFLKLLSACILNQAEEGADESSHLLEHQRSKPAQKPGEEAQDSEKEKGREQLRWRKRRGDGYGGGEDGQRT